MTDKQMPDESFIYKANGGFRVLETEAEFATSYTRTDIVQALREENQRLRAAVNALLNDIRRRYPGEDFKCPYIIELDRAIKEAGE